MLAVTKSSKPEKWARINVSHVTLGRKAATVTTLSETAESEAVLEVPVSVPVYGSHTLKIFGDQAQLEAMATEFNAVINDPSLDGTLPGGEYRAAVRQHEGRWYYSLIVKHDDIAKSEEPAEATDDAAMF